MRLSIPDFPALCVTAVVARRTTPCRRSGPQRGSPWRLRRKHGFTLANDDRVDIEPVLIDQVVSHEGSGEVGSAEHQVSTGLCLELYDLLGDEAPDHSGVPPARSRVLEYTILGMFRQMRANSTMGRSFSSRFPPVLMTSHDRPARCIPERERLATFVVSLGWSGQTRSDEVGFDVPETQHQRTEGARPEDRRGQQVHAAGDSRELGWNLPDARDSVAYAQQAERCNGSYGKFELKEETWTRLRCTHVT